MTREEALRYEALMFRELDYLKRRLPYVKKLCFRQVPPDVGDHYLKIETHAGATLTLELGSEPPQTAAALADRVEQALNLRDLHLYVPPRPPPFVASAVEDHRSRARGTVARDEPPIDVVLLDETEQLFEDFPTAARGSEYRDEKTR